MKLTLQRALIVEGRYDASKLASLVDGLILTTDGFAIYKDKSMQRLFKTLAKERGLILLTDSDAAGFQIRHYIINLVGAEHVVQAYVPAIPGKEARKTQPGKEGLLGVEGVPAPLIMQAIQTALACAPEQTAGKAKPKREILYSDLFNWGLSGTADCAVRRRRFLQQLGLPPRMSKKELIQILNTLYTYDSLAAQVQSLDET